MTDPAYQVSTVPRDGECLLNAVIGSAPEIVGRVLATRLENQPQALAWLRDHDQVRADLAAGRVSRPVVEALRGHVLRYLSHTNPAQMPSSIGWYRLDRRSAIEATVARTPSAQLVAALGTIDEGIGQFLSTGQINESYLQARAGELMTRTPGLAVDQARAIAADDRDGRGGLLSAPQQFQELRRRGVHFSAADLTDAALREYAVDRRIEHLRQAPITRETADELREAVANWDGTWMRAEGEAFPHLLAAALGIRIGYVRDNGFVGHSVGAENAPVVAVFHSGGNHYDAADPTGQRATPPASSFLGAFANMRIGTVHGAMQAAPHSSGSQHRGSQYQGSQYPGGGRGMGFGSVTEPSVPAMPEHLAAQVPELFARLAEVNPGPVDNPAYLWNCAPAAMAWELSQRENRVMEAPTSDETIVGTHLINFYRQLTGLDESGLSDDQVRQSIPMVGDIDAIRAAMSEAPTGSRSIVLTMPEADGQNGHILSAETAVADGVPQVFFLDPQAGEAGRFWAGTRRFAMLRMTPDIPAPAGARTADDTEWAALTADPQAPMALGNRPDDQLVVTPTEENRGLGAVRRLINLLYDVTPPPGTGESGPESALQDAVAAGTQLIDEHGATVPGSEEAAAFLSLLYMRAAADLGGTGQKPLIEADEPFATVRMALPQPARDQLAEIGRDFIAERFGGYLGLDEDDEAELNFWLAEHLDNDAAVPTSLTFSLSTPTARLANSALLVGHPDLPSVAAALNELSNAGSPWPYSDASVALLTELSDPAATLSADTLAPLQNELWTQLATAPADESHGLAQASEDIDLHPAVIDRTRTRDFNRRAARTMDQALAALVALELARVTRQQAPLPRNISGRQVAEQFSADPRGVVTRLLLDLNRHRDRIHQAQLDSALPLTGLIMDLSVQANPEDTVRADLRDVVAELNGVRSEWAVERDDQGWPNVATLATVLDLDADARRGRLIDIVESLADEARDLSLAPLPDGEEETHSALQTQWREQSLPALARSRAILGPLLEQLINENLDSEIESLTPRPGAAALWRTPEGWEFERALLDLYDRDGRPRGPREPGRDR